LIEGDHLMMILFRQQLPMCDNFTLKFGGVAASNILSATSLPGDRNSPSHPEAAMVDLQFSLRGSQFFATTATLKERPAAAIAVLLGAARLLAQAAPHPTH
jgi:hypothetical protein